MSNLRSSKLSSFASNKITLFLFLAAVAVGCASKEKKTDEETMPDTVGAADNSQMGDSDSGNAMGLQTINFPFDSFVLTSEAKSKLQSNAEIMKSNQAVKVQIEGHCDERGGIQYNLALGEKRANSVKKFLKDLGIDDDRLKTISFGKERPVDAASSEEAWAKNRRANFAIVSK